MCTEERPARWLPLYVLAVCVLVTVLGVWQGGAAQHVALHLADRLAPVLATPALR